MELTDQSLCGRPASYVPLWLSKNCGHAKGWLRDMVLNVLFPSIYTCVWKVSGKGFKVGGVEMDSCGQKFWEDVLMPWAERRQRNSSPHATDSMGVWWGWWGELAPTNGSRGPFLQVTEEVFKSAPCTRLTDFSADGRKWAGGMCCHW